MRKILVLVVMASLVTAGAALAGVPKLAQPDATFAFGTAGVAAGPATTNNDDSCDIGVAPAATLLLPYFEVETAAVANARYTLFTITNTSSLNQIAHITVWTDWSFPVIDFNIWFSPYDVVSISMRDLILGPAATGVPTIPATSAATAANRRNTQNVNHQGNPPATCVGLPGAIPAEISANVRSLLTTGLAANTFNGCQVSGAQVAVGGNHGTVATGYVTIDVNSTCSVTLPIDPEYYATEILFDNVFIGDYQDVNTVPGDAGGSPLVHIRAVPEGGARGSIPTDALGGPAVTNLPYTFYDRYTFGNSTGFRTIDRRQPLPSAFAARYISSAALSFDTSFKIWREGITGSTTSLAAAGAGGCNVPAGSIPAGIAAPMSAYQFNNLLAVADVVRFDERENAASVIAPAGGIISPVPPGLAVSLPEAVRVDINDADATPLTNNTFSFPAMPGPAPQDAGGWVYWNLNNGGSDGTTPGTVPYSSSRPGFAGGTTTSGVRQSQNWVIVSMSTPVLSADFDAAWLGNGCSPAPAATSGTTEQTIGTGINPSGGVLVCPPGTVTGAGTTAGCTGTNATP